MIDHEQTSKESMQPLLDGEVDDKYRSFHAVSNDISDMRGITMTSLQAMWLMTRFLLWSMVIDYHSDDWVIIYGYITTSVGAIVMCLAFCTSACFNADIETMIAFCVYLSNPLNKLDVLIVALCNMRVNARENNHDVMCYLRHTTEFATGSVSLFSLFWERMITTTVFESSLYVICMAYEFGLLWLWAANLSMELSLKMFGHFLALCPAIFPIVSVLAHLIVRK